MPNIELPVMIQKRFVDIGLYDVRFGLSIRMLFLLYLPIDILRVHQRYPIAPITILPRLQNPHLLPILPILLKELLKPLISGPTNVKCLRYVLKGIRLDNLLIVVAEGVEEGFLRAD